MDNLDFDIINLFSNFANHSKSGIGKRTLKVSATINLAFALSA